MDPENIPAKFEVRSFAHSWENNKLELRVEGYSKKLGSPWIRPRCLFSKNFYGLVFGWTLWIYRPNLQSVALAVYGIIGGTSKNWEVPGFAHAPYSPKFLRAFVRMDLWIYLPNLTFIVLPIPEIIGGISKIGECLDSPTLPILANF